MGTHLDALCPSWAGHLVPLPKQKGPRDGTARVPSPGLAEPQQGPGGTAASDGSSLSLPWFRPFERPPEAEGPGSHSGDHLQGPGCGGPYTALPTSRMPSSFFLKTCGQSAQTRKRKRQPSFLQIHRPPLPGNNGALPRPFLAAGHLSPPRERFYHLPFLTCA